MASTALAAPNIEVMNLERRIQQTRTNAAIQVDEALEKGKKQLAKLSAEYSHLDWVKRVARYVGALAAGLTVSMLDKIKSWLPSWLAERVPDSLIPALVGVLAILVGMWTENEMVAAFGDGALVAAIGLFTSGLIEGGV